MSTNFVEAFNSLSNKQQWIIPCPVIPSSVKPSLKTEINLLLSISDESSDSYSAAIVLANNLQYLLVR